MVVRVPEGGRVVRVASSMPQIKGDYRSIQACWSTALYRHAGLQLHTGMLDYSSIQALVDSSIQACWTTAPYRHAGLQLHTGMLVDSSIQACWTPT